MAEGYVGAMDAVDQVKRIRNGTTEVIGINDES